MITSNVQTTVIDLRHLKDTSVEIKVTCIKDAKNSKARKTTYLEMNDNLMGTEETPAGGIIITNPEGKQVISVERHVDRNTWEVINCPSNMYPSEAIKIAFELKKILSKL